MRSKVESAVLDWHRLLLVFTFVRIITRMVDVCTVAIGPSVPCCDPRNPFHLGAVALRFIRMAQIDYPMHEHSLSRLQGRIDRLMIEVETVIMHKYLAL